MSATPLDANGLPKGYAFRPEYEVTPRDAKAGHERDPEHHVIVDVRLLSEIEVAAIPGAIHIPLHELEDRADEIPKGPGVEVAALCHHGVRSMKAALALRALGWPTAKSIAGGIEAWSLGADPGVPRYEREGAICRVVK